VLPDLGLESSAVVSGGWLIGPGQTVVEGDHLLEVHSNSVSVQLPAPASGRLLRTLVREGDWLNPGQRLAVIELERWDEG